MIMTTLNIIGFGVPGVKSCILFRLENAHQVGLSPELEIIQPFALQYWFLLTKKSIAAIFLLPMERSNISLILIMSLQAKQ